MRYRVSGEARWHSGETENISSSGVLFDGEWAVTLNDLLDLRLSMPIASTEGAVEMACRAVVVRAGSEPCADGRLAMATRFIHCHWTRP